MVYFLERPQFTKSADEVDCAADVWLYLLNHARDGGELPDFGSGIARMRWNASVWRTPMMNFTGTGAEHDNEGRL
jgi:hypothetical protein